MREVEKKIIRIQFFGHKMKSIADTEPKFDTIVGKNILLDICNKQQKNLFGLGTGHKKLFECVLGLYERHKRWDD